MIGIDTNVLVRHVVQDDFGQSRTATRLDPRHCTREDRERAIERREPS